MATKPRYRKTAMQLWIGDSRKAGKTGDGTQPYSSADLARWTGVSMDTARGWESRGRPSQDAIDELERRFGTPAPLDDGGVAGQEALIAALRDQTEVLTALVGRVNLMLAAHSTAATELMHAIGTLASRLDRPGMQGASGPATRAGTGR